MELNNFLEEIEKRPLFALSCDITETKEPLEQLELIHCLLWHIIKDAKNNLENKEDEEDYYILNEIIDQIGDILKRSAKKDYAPYNPPKLPISLTLYDFIKTTYKDFDFLTRRIQDDLNSIKEFETNDDDKNLLCDLLDIFDGNLNRYDFKNNLYNKGE